MILIIGFGLVIPEIFHYLEFMPTKTIVPQNIQLKMCRTNPNIYFPISLKGLKENDFTMVMGYPGRTQEYLPSFAIEQIVNT
jgi:hypothetical protein